MMLIDRLEYQRAATGRSSVSPSRFSGCRYHFSRVGYLPERLSQWCCSGHRNGTVQGALRLLPATVHDRGESVSVSSIALPAESRVQTRALEVTALLALGTVASVLTVGFLTHSPVLVSPTTTAIVRGLYVGAYVAAGAYTWWRRPASLTGPMIAGVGLIFALTTLNGSGDPAAHTVGMTLWAGLLVLLAYVYLAFPRSRLGSPVERSLVVGYAAFAMVTWGAVLVFSDKLPIGAAFTDCGDRCPHNAFQLVDAGNV